MQEKISKNHTNREEKERIGINKVTGLSKPQKHHPEEPQSPWVFTGKGKSLGKKSTTGIGSVREKDFVNSRARIFKEPKYKNEDEEYAEDW